MGQFALSIEAYDRGLARFPGHLKCLCNKAQALEQLGRRLEALVTAQAALRLDPESQEALLLCGTFELRLGNAARPMPASDGRREGRGAQLSGRAEAGQFRILMLFSPEAGNTPYEI